MCVHALPSAKLDLRNKFHYTGPLRNVDFHFLSTLSLQ